jgi:hypothetical protein
VQNKFHENIESIFLSYYFYQNKSGLFFFEITYLHNCEVVNKVSEQLLVSGNFHWTLLKNCQVTGKGHENMIIN